MKDLHRAGPTQKTLATQHLEYIVHAMLATNDEPRGSVAFSYRNGWTVTIMGQEFNLTHILAAEPQFEFISLSDNQLNAYLLLNGQSSTNYANDHVHPAELAALRKYASLGYIEMNALLRGKAATVNQVKANILPICVAAHAIHKHSQSPFLDTSKLYRGEQSTAHIKPTKGLLTSFGFLSTSKKSGLANKSFKTTKGAVTEFYPNVSSGVVNCELPGLDLSLLSHTSHEAEVLFPPYATFQYKKLAKGRFAARPIYSVDSPQKPYKHSFSDKELAAIKRDHLYLKMQHKGGTKEQAEVIEELIGHDLLHFLSQAKLANKHHKWYQKFFDTVDNKQKIGCLDSVIDALQLLNSKSKENFDETDVSHIITQINDSIETNKRLVRQSKLPAALGKTHESLGTALEMATATLQFLKKLRGSSERGESSELSESADHAPVSTP